MADPILGMIAVFPRPDESRMLAIPDGESPDQLHVTLVFLGEHGVDFDDGTFTNMAYELEQIAAAHPQLIGSIGGYGRFASETRDAGPSTYPAIAFPDVTGLSHLRESVVRGLSNVGFVSPSEHDWVAHLTLAYVPDGEPIEEAPIGAPLHFDALSLIVGENHLRFPFQEVPDMPWSIKQRGTRYCVVKKGESEPIPGGCHATREEAEDQLQALYANEDARVMAQIGEVVIPVRLQFHNDSQTETQTLELMAESLPPRFHGIAAPEGIRSGDGRRFDPESLSWRELPLPLMYQPMEPESGGHALSVQVGRIDTLERRGAEIYFAGDWNLEHPMTEQAMHEVTEQIKRWVSVDLGDLSGSDFDINQDAESGDLQIDFHKAVILGMTIVSFPAFSQAVILPFDAEIPPATENGRPAAGGIIESGTPSIVGERGPEVFIPLVGGLVAAVIDLPDAPPAGWFLDPQLNGPTPVSITDTGRVFGHVAQWDVCHRGFAHECVLAPRSPSAYAEFHVGGFVNTRDGERIRVGHLTMDGPHAPTTLDSHSARRHYDDSTTIWAHVRAGEDQFGIWVAGTLAPGLTPEQILRARACALSGDWRSDGGALEMIAALSVPVPGFPVLAASADCGCEQDTPTVRAHIVGGKILSLVAAGCIIPSMDEAGRRAHLREQLHRQEMRASL